MLQLIAVILVFLSIPFLNHLKLKLSYTLFIAVGLLSILSNIGIKSVIDSIISVFVVKSSLNILLTVLMISILGGVMNKYKILQSIVETIILLTGNLKLILMIIPAMLGVLIIPGGALLSAPFIKEIGDKYDIPPGRAAAINLVFRHVAIYVMPYSNGLLIVAASLPMISIPRLILFNLFFLIPALVVGYYLYIRNIKDIDNKAIYNSKENDYKSNTFILKNIIKIVIYTSPIYVCLIINSLTGLPYYISLMVSLFIVYLLSDKKDFICNIFKSINWEAILAIIATLIMKEIILRMDDLIFIFNSMFDGNSSTLYIMVIFFISSLFFGLITGNQSASLAIILPMIAQLKVSVDMLHLYTFFAFVSAYLGYYFSPLHLCQSFTLQYMNADTMDLYKEYKFYMPILLLILFASMFIIKAIFIIS